MNKVGVPGTPPRPSTPGTTETSQESSDEPEQEFSFASDMATTLDAAALEILKKVRQIDLPSQPSDSFASERPVGPTITDQDMIGTPLFWGNDVAGRRVFVFIYKDGGGFGFDEEVFVEIQTLI